MADLAAAGAVILAAGSSRRLGRPKQLVDLEGKPLLQHVVDAAGDAGVGELVLVLGHRAGEVAAAIALPAGARIVVNPDHATGQASSLLAGLEALGTGIRRAVVLLGDQPRISPRAIRAVAMGAGPIVRAVYDGVPGHPVAFDREVWDEIAASVRGDRGAREVVERDPARVRGVSIDRPAPGDVDTDEDYARLTAPGPGDGASRRG